MRALYRRCEATVSASPALSRRLRRLGLRNVHDIPLGVDLELFTPARRARAVRDLLGIPEERLLLAYAGRLDVEKRTDLLLQAVRGIPATRNVTMAFIGDGPLRPLVEAAAREDARIRLLPHVTDRAALASFLASADLYVTAAPHETFGLSILEAQACGLAVAGVRAGALVERVTPDTGMLAEPESAEDLTRCIGELLANGFRDRGRRARGAAARFSWANTFGQLLDLYHRLA